MTKTIVNYGNNGHLTGVLMQPNDANNNLPLIMFINAGVVYRIGPNRIYYKIAEHLTQIGFTTFRFDFSGIGDSEMSEDLTQSFDDYQLNETKESIDFILGKTGKKKCILIGICSGADIAYQMSLYDDRVNGIIPINGSYYSKSYFNYQYPKAKNQIAVNYYKKYWFHYNRLLKVIKGQSNILKNVKKVFFNKNTKGKTDLLKFSKNDWGKILSIRINTLLVFSEGSVFFELFKLDLFNEIKSSNVQNNLSIEIVKNTDHVFTTISSQDYLTNLITQWLKTNY